MSVTFGALPYTHRTHLFWSHRTESNREPANYKSAALPIEPRWHLEWQTGLEPATSSLEGWRSAIELLPQMKLTRRINHTGSIYQRLFLVRKAGIEPARLQAGDFKSPMSSISITTARGGRTRTRTLNPPVMSR